MGKREKPHEVEKLNTNKCEEDITTEWYVQSSKPEQLLLNNNRTMVSLQQ